MKDEQLSAFSWITAWADSDGKEVTHTMIEEGRGLKDCHSTYMQVKKLMGEGSGSLREIIETLLKPAYYFTYVALFNQEDKSKLSD